MADFDSIDPDTDKLSIHFSKNIGAKQSKTIVCRDCSIEAPRTGPSQFLCVACSDRRTLVRKLKWTKANPPTKAAVSAKSKRKRSRMGDRGAAVSEIHRQQLSNLFSYHLPSSWHVRLSVPFSYAGSKNHAASIAAQGHIFLKAETRGYRQSIELAVREAISGIKVVTAKVWLELIIQKPNHRGDAINLLDVVADGVKKGIGVDDRWFCVSRLDWQIVKDSPCILIGIGQDETEECRVCSYCGQVKTLALFKRNNGSPLGYSRECLECGRAGGKSGTPKVTAEQVRAIREAAASGATAIELSRHFPIGRASIMLIIQRKTWKEIE